MTALLTPHTLLPAHMHAQPRPPTPAPPARPIQVKGRRKTPASRAQEGPSAVRTARGERCGRRQSSKDGKKKWQRVIVYVTLRFTTSHSTHTQTYKHTHERIQN
jgi:hypothetical protein